APAIPSQTTASARDTATDAQATTSPSPEPVPARTDQSLATDLPQAGLLAVGMVALLSTLRAVQQRRRRTGRRIALPEAELATAELALRAGELPELAELVELAMRAMAAGMRRDGIEPPKVLGVTLGREHLEVLLEAETAAAPRPF